MTSKPGNLLLNAKCDLKLCDFGLARGGVPLNMQTSGQHCVRGDDDARLDDDAPSYTLTDYVITRWYRPPELLLMSTYNHSVDLWSAGCIMAEVLNRKAFLPGRDYLNQLALLTEVVEVPPEAEVETFLTSDEGKKYLKEMV